MQKIQFRAPVRCPFCHECQPYPSTLCCTWG